MKNLTINNVALTLSLGPVETDPETASWRNGEVILPDGTKVPCGGGWIETEESANQKNEEAGIAGGLRQGVSYPNETVVGEFSPYGFGEDESGWQEKVMPAIYGADWEEREDADDEARKVHASIQEALAAQV